jgi:hypothetical protein
MSRASLPCRVPRKPIPYQAKTRLPSPTLISEVLFGNDVVDIACFLLFFTPAMAFLRTFVSQGAVLLLLSTNACRVVQCVPLDAAPSTIVAQTRGDTGRILHGLVLALPDGRPLPSARVRIPDAGDEWHPVDSAGRITLHVVAPGSYTVEVTAAGFSSASRTVVARSDSGLVWISVLGRMPVTKRNGACAALADTTTRQTDAPSDDSSAP